ncbi:hypothetical protein DUNSADRAFT_12914 [Dunaliella salina]|uniref:Encoded protein n=1 Tax=Dunaliella salina TaxID=3046 RepID=A0ABQ7GAG4_DUNSA|nr:hypothetical protein DUNSADRAFT_12914 [Dunaliella salina]|eukprot:KAF5831602.1 hypothetical protein DUNSADRAFT_12914 [Dunaliella salina]
MIHIHNWEAAHRLNTPTTWACSSSQAHRQPCGWSPNSWLTSSRLRLSSTSINTRRTSINASSISVYASCSSNSSSSSSSRSSKTNSWTSSNASSSRGSSRSKSHSRPITIAASSRCNKNTQSVCSNSDLNGCFSAAEMPREGSFVSLVSGGSGYSIGGKSSQGSGNGRTKTDAFADPSSRRSHKVLTESISKGVPTNTSDSSMQGVSARRMLLLGGLGGLPLMPLLGDAGSGVAAEGAAQPAALERGPPLQGSLEERVFTKGDVTNPGNSLFSKPGVILYPK